MVGLQLRHREPPPAGFLAKSDKKKNEKKTLWELAKFITGESRNFRTANETDRESHRDKAN